MPDPQPDPAAQAKGMRRASRAMVFAGLMIGIGMPVLLSVMKITVSMTSSGFDLIWLPCLAIMIADFVLARFFARRAEAIERSLPPA